MTDIRNNMSDKNPKYLIYEYLLRHAYDPDIAIT